MKILYLLGLILFVIGCGELENPGNKRKDVFTSSITGREPEVFTPNFDEVKKRQIEIKVKPEFNILGEEADKEPELTQDIIERSARYDPNLPVNEINLDIGFRSVGSYTEDGCLVTMYKKEYKVTWLYIHVDCKGNRIKIHKDK